MKKIRYFKVWSIIKRSPQGPLTENEANRYHLEGVSYSVVPESVSSSTPIITLNSIPGFIGITAVDHELRVTYSSNFSRTKPTLPCRLALVFHFEFSSGDEWVKKTTYSMSADGRIHREIRTFNPPNAIVTEIAGDFDLPEIPFPDFGHFELCYAYQEPDFAAFFRDATQNE